MFLMDWLTEINETKELNISAPVIGPITLIEYFSAPWGVYSPELPWRQVAFSSTISTSTLAGTHLPLGEEKQLQ